MNRVAALIDTEAAEHPALELAKTLLNTEGGTVDVITTIRNAPQLLQMMWPDQIKSFERELLTAKQSQLNRIARDQRNSSLTIDSFVLEGTPFLEIIHLVKRNRIE